MTRAEVSEELLPQLIARRALEHPDRLFVTEIDGVSATYAQLDAQARRWADAFRRCGVRRGDYVASMQPPGIDELSTWVGLSWLGAVQVPLNLDYRGRMLVHALTLTQARVAVVPSTHVERLREVAADLPHLELVITPDASGADPEAGFRVIGRDEFLADAVVADGLRGPQPWDSSVVLLTSGTTGPSKAVALPWRQLHVWSRHQFPLPLMDSSDVWYGPWPTFHITGKYPPYLMALAGGRLVLRDRLSATSFVDDIYAHGITTTILALGLVPLLERAPAAAEDADIPLRNVVMVPVVPDFEQFEKRWGLRISTSYAMTEIGAALIRWPGEIDELTRASVGRPAPGFELRIVDEHDREVAVGEVGELVVRAEQPWTLNAGYVGMPEQTAQAWRNGWFHTGDALRRDDEGNYYFVDRIKDCIRRRGENISSFDVEMHVNQHSDVLESAAIPVPAGVDGEDVKVVVVRTPASMLNESDLYEFLEATMPRFMLPRYIEFVDELPKTPTQKVRKVELRAQPLTDRTWSR